MHANMEYPNLRNRYVVTVMTDDGTIVRRFRKSTLHRALTLQEVLYNVGFHSTLDVLAGSN